jgi:hypothetical protein
MIKRTFGAPFGGTTRAGQYGFDCEALRPITPPNFCGGGGSCSPLIVVVAVGEPGVPVVCGAGATAAERCCAPAGGETRPARKSAAKATDVTPNGKMPFLQFMCPLPLLWRFLKRVLLASVKASPPPSFTTQWFLRVGPVEISSLELGNDVYRWRFSGAGRMEFDGLRSGVAVQCVKPEPGNHRQGSRPLDGAASAEG